MAPADSPLPQNLRATSYKGQTDSLTSPGSSYTHRPQRSNVMP